ncbi:hypothetical protein EV175_005568 [Coemansia sp. RSA 1933]|nr:hypothetical protein EV175_005568 [Coemansia sp. RSA 1933]
MFPPSYDDAIQYAFPALLLAIFVYVTKDWIANRLAERRRSKLDPHEVVRKRMLAIQQNKKQNASAAENDSGSSDNKKSSDTAEFFVKPQMPKPTTAPFGSQSMTMADLRSRITRNSGGTCSYGSMDLDMVDQIFESGDRYLRNAEHV